VNERRTRHASRTLKDAVFDQFARITKALASAVRLEIVDVLAHGERSVEAGAAVLIDVRPEAEYRAGHIPGARSIPVGQPAARRAELPLDETVAAYCRGRYCVMSYDALAFQRSHGRRLVRSVDGLPGWRARGRPVHVACDGA
jgi:rhodanese-related sulfurtransferase